MRASFETFAARHGARLSDLKCKGAFLPFGEVRPVPGKGRVLLAGDAAGLVDPITGEGIAWAMKSGALAATAVVEALRMGGADTALARYSRALRPIQTELRRARALRWLAYQPGFSLHSCGCLRQSRGCSGDTSPCCPAIWTMLILAGARCHAWLGLLRRARGRAT